LLPSLSCLQPVTGAIWAAIPPPPAGVVAVLVLADGVEEVVPIGEECLAGSIAEGCHLGGARRWNFMGGHDPESPEVRVRPADVDAGLPVRLVPGVVVVGALLLDAKTSRTRTSDEGGRGASSVRSRLQCP